MDWFKKHVDTTIILGAVLTATCWMNNNLNKLNDKIVSVEKDVAIIKTVLLMHRLLPSELAAEEK